MMTEFSFVGELYL